MRDADSKRIREGLKRRETGTFNLSDIYGPGWNDLYVGDKVKIGNEFQRLAARGDFADVTDTGRKSGGGRVYRKEGKQ